MPKKITQSNQINVGDIYEDSYCHPCLCVGKQEDEIKGVSLVDGSYPRSEDLRHSQIRHLTVAEAWQWRMQGPGDKELDIVGRWWDRDKPVFLTNPAKALENLFFFALYQVEWNGSVQEKLGIPIKHEWHDVTYKIEENHGEGRAEIHFKIIGSKGSGLVNVTAYKTENDWPIEDLAIEIKGETIDLIKDGKGLGE